MRTMSPTAKSVLGCAILVGLRDDPGLDGAGGEVEQLVDGALGGVRLDVAVVGLDGTTLEGEGEADAVVVHAEVLGTGVVTGGSSPISYIITHRRPRYTGFPSLSLMTVQFSRSARARLRLFSARSSSFRAQPRSLPRTTLPWV